MRSKKNNLRSLDKTIKRAARIIRQGGVVAFPTETVYGLGANALDPKAVARVFKIKKRPRFDPLIVHIANQNQLDFFVEEVPRKARKLARHFWPGPLTLVLIKKPIIPDIVTAGLPGVAIRVPDHPIARKLILHAGVPIAAPSANRFGAISPTTPAHVLENLGKQVDLILDGGPCRIGVESTVISFIEKEPVLLRPGGISIEEIESVIGRILILNRKENLKILSPGMLERHYAPRTPLMLGSLKKGLEILSSQPMKRIGLLTFKKTVCAQKFVAIEILSASGDLDEAAANLFSAMRRLDDLKLDFIIARPVPEVGLGRAIMDRLRRASSLKSN